ncbi:PAS domain-containing protein [Bradyrhizobium jicamae]|uniref:sensor histidine kinase n=1 Tax=Bradyrhizobium jicamae TaxID=280332 RepID=UPI001BA8969D|nr:HWE histidine kinase domain-containing protein [Bradyrhizobium jicamae]MBR0756086.1 PAS domain-containing protein [Bradyrhizobium jicamae]
MPENTPGGDDERDGPPASGSGSPQNSLDQVDLARALREAEARFACFGEISTDVLWIRNADTLQWEYLSPAFEQVFGAPRDTALAGQDWIQWAEFILEDDRQQALGHIGRVCDGERAVFECRIRRAADGATRWLRHSAFPMHDEHGHVTRIGCIGQDISALKHAADRQQALLWELQHRVRNTLAVIRVLVQRTAESSKTVQDFANHLDGRIAALSRIKAAIHRDPLAGFDLAELVFDALLGCAAHEGEHFTLDGPQLRLDAKAAESMGLAFHELATNAVEHGAFTSRLGRVEVRWRLEPRGAVSWLVLDWVERGMQGRAVVPSREGFGTALLQRLLRDNLNAEVTRRFEPDGFNCTIAFPLPAHVP